MQYCTEAGQTPQTARTQSISNATLFAVCWCAVASLSLDFWYCSRIATQFCLHVDVRRARVLKHRDRQCILQSCRICIARVTAGSFVGQHLIYIAIYAQKPEVKCKRIALCPAGEATRHSPKLDPRCVCLVRTRCKGFGPP